MQPPDHFLLRLAGLPVTALHAVRFERVAALASALERGGRQLSETSAALCDRLHAFVRTQTDASTRLTLIDLKRCVHNRRPSQARALIAAMHGTLASDPGLAEALDEWAVNAEEHAKLQASGNACLALEHDQVRRKLRAAWTSEEFQTGVLMANRRLYDGLVQYLSRSSADGKKSRQLEQTALAYYIRMVTKTSPFSTFTYSAAGAFNGATQMPARPLFRSSYTVELSLVEALFRAVISPAKRIAGLPLVVNETATREGDEWLLLTRGDDHGDARRVPEDEFKVVTHGPAVEVVIGALRASGAALSVDALVAALRDRLDARVPEERLRDFVARLHECGLLTCAIRYDSNAPDALSNLISTAAHMLGPAEPEFRRVGQCIGAGVATLATTSVPDRAEIAQRTEASARHLAGLVGANGTRTEVKAPVRQDCYLDDDVVLEAREFEGVFSALSALDRIMPLFDAGSLLRQQVRRYYLERYGADVSPRPLTAFLRDFCVDYYQRWLADADSTVWDPFLTDSGSDLPSEALEMARLRGAFADAVLGQVAARAGGELKLPAETCESFAEQARNFRTRAVASSTGYFGQPARLENGHPLSFVLNQVVSGDGAYLARHCDSRLFGHRADRLRRQLADRLAARDDVERVEVVATLGLNIQVHPLLTPRCIIYPGENVRLTERDRVIPWSSLYVRFDPATDSVALITQPGGRRLLPLRMGPVSPHLLPVPYRVLVSLGGGAVPDFALLSLLELRAAPIGSDVRSYPRITFGDLVLLRRTWRIPAPAAPPRGRPETDFAAFMELRRWARQLDLPSRVFVIAVEITDYFRQRRRSRNLQRLYKPFHVDFDNPLSCQLLHRFTDSVESTLTISEMLPAPEQLFFHVGGNPYVGELLLEIS
jgi:hypothetical protein